MPSLATRMAYQGLALASAQDALADAAAEVAAATEALEQLEAGTLEVDAIVVGGVRFINDGGSLVAEP
jgi:hypothetical protein